tara:strand:+ start:881 stop:1093 length:213 start_codon:yes stop_codon:yes gene_type:complete
LAGFCCPAFQPQKYIEAQKRHRRVTEKDTTQNANSRVIGARRTVKPLLAETNIANEYSIIANGRSVRDYR